MYVQRSLSPGSRGRQRARAGPTFISQTAAFKILEDEEAAFGSFVRSPPFKRLSPAVRVRPCIRPLMQARDKHHHPSKIHPSVRPLNPPPPPLSQKEPNWAERWNYPELGGPPALPDLLGPSALVDPCNLMMVFSKDVGGGGRGVFILSREAFRV